MLQSSDVKGILNLLRIYGRGVWDMAVTIKDVAKKKAGVSYSTVSRALNDPNADKSDKKKRILKIAEEMGYVPNQAAIQLKMSRSYVIGLYFSTISKMSSPLFFTMC